MADLKRVPHCSHWGAYTIVTQDGRIVAIEPGRDDPAPSPIIDSVKNWTDPSLRVLHPMVRSGWLDPATRGQRHRRGKDAFVPVSWDRAIDLVAGEIRRVIDRHGNPSIFAGSYGWTSAGRFHHAATLLKRMLNLLGGYTDHVDTYSIAAGPVILRHTLGSDEACYGQSSTLDTVAKHTETLFVFGALSPRTAQNEAGGLATHSLEARLRELVARKVRIILISPLRDDLPDWVDCEWWPIRPNTDTALMLAIAGEIVRAGRQDDVFLSRCCSGSEHYLDYLKGTRGGPPRSAEWAAAITGVPAEKIRAASRWMVESRAMLTVSWSLQRARFGEQPFWAALGLAAVAGQIGLPGGGVGFGYGSTGGSGAPIGKAKSPGMKKGRNPTGSFIPVARIADMLLHPGEPYTYEGELRHYPDTRLVYWAGGNPYHHHQDLNRLEQAWSRPETIIVQDPVWNATALRADIVLPASTSIERNDIAGNGRTSHFIAMRKAIEPMGEARGDFDIFAALADRLGVGAAFTEGRDEMGWIRHLYQQSRDQAAEQLDHRMPEFEEFWETGRAEVPVKSDYTYLESFRRDPAAHPLRTESGLIVLGSEKLRGLAHADCLSHPAWLEPEEWQAAAPGAGMLALISHQPAGRLHSQLPDGPPSRALKRQGREILRLHPDEAQARGINPGAMVRIFNARGACLAVVDCDPLVSRGVAVLPTGAWFAPTPEDGLDLSGNPNVLTADLPSSVFGQGCAAYTCLVQVEPATAPQPDAGAYYAARLSDLTKTSETA